APGDALDDDRGVLVDEDRHAGREPRGASTGCPGGSRRPPPGGDFRSSPTCASSQDLHSQQEVAMALTIKRITLWRREVANQPGVLASTLEPLARAGADLRLVIGNRFPGGTGLAAIQVLPVSRKNVSAVAVAAGVHAIGLAFLLLAGDNRPTLGA